jgi:MoaA/NifB/PqqE/SkfB family radical SAM enzyme
MELRLYSRVEHFGSVVFNPHSGKYYELGDAETSALQEVFNKEYTPEPATQLLLEKILGSTRNALHNITIVRIKNSRARPDVLSVPFKVFFNITKKCNLFCTHCYNDSGYRNSPELEFEHVSRALQELQNRGIFKVTISGGEPLFHSHISEILQFLGDLDLVVSLITNGIPVTPSLAKRISETRNLRSITVSIDGATAQENDVVRGDGSFDRALQGLRVLREYYAGKLAVRITLMKTNLASIYRFPRLLSDLGVEELKVNRVNPYGRAFGNNSVLLPEDEYRKVRDKLYEQAIGAGIRMEVPSFKYQIDSSGLVGLCRAGQESFEIDGDGNVYPCSFSFGKFLAGNVKNRDYTSIFHNLQLHSINNEHCYSCRGRGGAGEMPIGYVPKLVELRRSATLS